jgi:hypothetical protein
LKQFVSPVAREFAFMAMSLTFVPQTRKPTQIEGSTGALGLGTSFTPGTFVPFEHFQGGQWWLPGETKWNKSFVTCTGRGLG